jgi:hypothetical protein
MNERIKDLYKQSANQDYFPIDSEEVYMSAKDLKKFAKTYLEEKRLLLAVMTKADPGLHAMAAGYVGTGS